MSSRVKGRLVRMIIGAVAFISAAPPLLAQKINNPRYNNMLGAHLQTWREPSSGNGYSGDLKHGSSLAPSPVGQSYVYDPNYSYRYSPDSTHRAAGKPHYERHAYSRGPTEYRHDTSARNQVWNGMDGLLAGMAQYKYGIPFGTLPEVYGLKDARVDYRGYLPIYENLMPSRIFLRIYREQRAEPSAGGKTLEAPASAGLLQMVSASRWNENAAAREEDSRTGVQSRGDERSAADARSGNIDEKVIDKSASRSGESRRNEITTRTSGGLVSVASSQTRVETQQRDEALPRTRMFILRRSSGAAAGPVELVPVK